MGRVTLNPLRHLDPVGSLMMLLTVISGFGIGWGKPVPVAPNRLRPNPRLGNGIVALAGPASNLLLGTILGLVLRALVPVAASIPFWVLLLLDSLAITNFFIGFFNLIPLPPLDGSSVLLGLLSLFKGRWVFHVTEFFHSLSRYGMMILLGVIFLGPLLGLNILGWLVQAPAVSALRRAILGVVGADGGVDAIGFRQGLGAHTGEPVSAGARSGRPLARRCRCSCGRCLRRCRAVTSGMGCVSWLGYGAQAGTNPICWPPRCCTMSARPRGVCRCPTVHSLS